MNFKKVLVVIAAVAPLTLIGATCANPQYALTSMQSADEYRAAHGLPELEWYWDARTVCHAFSLAGGVSDCDWRSPGLVIPYSCALIGILPPGSPTSSVPYWDESRTLPASDALCIPCYGCPPTDQCPPVLTPSPGGCLDEPLFKHAAIAAYTQDNGYVYEVVYLTE